VKSISAICATSEFVGRRRIEFNEATGLIVSVTESLAPADFTFGDECLLFAGMGDVHIHAREDASGEHTYKEDFLSARAAMINGGVTHAGDMPNNPVPPVDDTSYAQKLKLSGKAEGCLWHYAGIGPGTKPLALKVPYKVYMGPSIGELYFKDLRTLDETLQHYRGQWVSFHCEDPEILEAHKDGPSHHERRPIKAEVVATRDALALIERYELKGKLCHYSTSEGLRLIREARARGVSVEIEVTPQHLYFDLDHLPQEDLKPLQMNPPIRYETDRQELLRALRAGEIEYLATDHAPHTQEEKDRGHSGLTGLDTYGGFVCWLLTQGVSAERIALVTAENPGRFHNEFLPSWRKLSPAYENLSLGVGFLRPGYRASFTVLDTRAPYRVTRERLCTKVAHSPFLGHELPGSVTAVFLGGKRL
jgi:dihydroorotase